MRNYSLATTTDPRLTSFLQGGGQMGERIRSFDWQKTSLGAISNWPPHLKTAVNIAVQSPVPIALLWGREGYMIYNDGYAEFAGGKHPSILGQKVLEAWPEIPDLINDFMGKGFRGETLSYKDQPLVLYRNHVAEDLWVDLNYSPVMDETGQPAGVFAIVIETTQRVLAEKRQMMAEVRSRLAMGAAEMVGTWDWDLQTDKLYSDARFASWFSLSPEKGEHGAPLSDYLAGVHPDDVERVEACTQDVINTGKKFSIEYRVIPNGTIRWILVRGECLYDKEGKPWRFPGVVVDITDRKQIEEELLKYQKRLEQSNKELEQFATVASHDLKAPLRKIAIFSGALQHIDGHKFSEEGLDYLSRINRSATKMDVLTSDLLALSRVRRYGKPFKPVNLHNMLVEVLADLKHCRIAVNGTVEIGEMCTIDGDETQLYQLFQNLLTNALKFHRKDLPPVIQINCSQLENGQCAITVQDNGIGLEMKNADRIFEMFERLHGQQNLEGTGIGLALVKKIVERHNGTIRVESILDQGSTFTITLPLRQYP